MLFHIFSCFIVYTIYIIIRFSYSTSHASFFGSSTSFFGPSTGFFCPSTSFFCSSTRFFSFSCSFCLGLRLCCILLKFFNSFFGLLTVVFHIAFSQLTQ